MNGLFTGKKENILDSEYISDTGNPNRSQSLTWQSIFSWNSVAFKGRRGYITGKVFSMKIQHFSLGDKLFIRKKKGKLYLSRPKGIRTPFSKVAQYPSHSQHWNFKIILQSEWMQWPITNSYSCHGRKIASNFSGGIAESTGKIYPASLVAK